jgi:magnesium transporter
MSYSIHNNNLAFNESAVAQYMNTDFIVLDISLCVALAREQFFEKLKDDDIPSHIFIEDNGRLAGMIAVRQLLQTADTVQPVRALMIAEFIQLKPEDERSDVAGLLAHGGADVVPVVTHGKLVGCLTEREIAHLLEDDVTEDAQRQGPRCRWRNPIWKPVHLACGKNAPSGCCCCLSPKPIPARLSSILKRRWNPPSPWHSLFLC